MPLLRLLGTEEGEELAECDRCPSRCRRLQRVRWRSGRLARYCGPCWHFLRLAYGSEVEE